MFWKTRTKSHDLNGVNDVVLFLRKLSNKW